MTSFWLNDVNILFNRNYISEIIPNNMYDANRNLNAIVRASIIGSLLLYVISKNKNAFVFPLLVIMITIILYKNNMKIQTDEYIKNNKDNDIESRYLQHVLNGIKEKYREPTLNNPLMNLNLVDHDDKVALDSTNSIVSDKINKNLNFNKYSNPSDNMYKEYDPFDRFYTMPVTSVMNDQAGFAEWCYTSDSQCKSGKQFDCIKKRGRTGSGGGSTISS